MNAATPHIDPRVKYRSVSSLRQLTATALGELKDVLIVIQDNGKPLAVIVPYDLFLEIQKLTQ